MHSVWTYGVGDGDVEDNGVGDGDVDGDGDGDGHNDSEFPQDGAGCNSVDCGWREGHCVPGEIKGSRIILTDYKTVLTIKMSALSLFDGPNKIPKRCVTKDLKVEVCQ